MTDPETTETFTVAGLTAAIAQAVSRAFPNQIWVRGEIRDLSRPASGHVFFSLVDPDDDWVLLPVALFATEKRMVNRLLTRSGALRMTNGVDVRIRGEVLHYPQRGVVQVRMTFIDTDYTVGKLAAQRAKVLRALGADGLLERNSRVAMPLVPLRVGLLTSRGSAAEADFLSGIEASPYRFDVVLVDSRVQGVDAVATLIAGLDHLDGAVDLVAIVRGGGPATDLAAFDDEQLARRVAVMRIPVLTGIGHETDRTMADEVAARVHKTPTEAAAAIVALVAAFDHRLDTVGRRIAAGARRKVAGDEAALAARHQRLVRSSRRALATQLQRLGASGGRIAGHARRTLTESRGSIAQRTQRLMRTAPLALERATLGLGARQDRIASADPIRLLDRGWSITRTADGSVLRGIGSLGVGDTIATTVAGGSVSSEVTDVTAIGDDAEQQATETRDGDTR